MYKNALKEDLIRVVEDLDGTVESTDTIVKLKTKIENSSTFESDPDFETATHISIREAEDWFRPIDLAKECDIYISSRSGSHKEIPITYGYTQDSFKNRSRNLKPKIIENYPQYLERENKNCYICGDSSHYTRDCEKRFKPKESNSHIHNRINANTLKVESEKQNNEFAHLQYVSIFVENQPVTALIDSRCQIPVLNSSLIRVNQPSEEIITLSSCFGEQRMVEVKPINISLNQLSPSLSVRTAISPTLTEEFIIHPSVYAEIKKLGHAKSDVLLNESESSLGAVSFSNVSVSNSPLVSMKKEKRKTYRCGQRTKEKMEQVRDIKTFSKNRQILFKGLSRQGEHRVTKCFATPKQLKKLLLVLSPASPPQIRENEVPSGQSKRSSSPSFPPLLSTACER
ncbi:hypothetical protein TNCV_218371 [Trichonephila clavipes]|uniref:CCHC-type domain-containing protein n=1 Tax=Trichonephila clavipes TaxID=2585209 RepID=A0A8X6S6C0_TRICX|nr:hypothetical protein TNCV_218371 [Trichonephila clavipes]